MVTQLVEALHYKLEGPGFDSLMSLEFVIDIIHPAALWPWGQLNLIRNEYCEYFLGGKDGQYVGLTTFWHPHGLSRPVYGLLYLASYRYIKPQISRLHEDRKYPQTAQF
jgi:hypothetical protein